MSDNQIHENEDGYPSRPVSVVPYSPAEQMPSNNERPFTGGTCGICRKAAATLRQMYTTTSKLVQTWENVVYTNQNARQLRRLAEDNILQAIMKIKGIQNLECFCQSFEQSTRNNDSSIEDTINPVNNKCVFAVNQQPPGPGMPRPGVEQLQQQRMGQVGQHREGGRSNLPSSGYLGGGGYSFGQAGQSECPPQPPGQRLGRLSRLNPAKRSKPQKHHPSSSPTLQYPNNPELPYSNILNSQDNSHGQMLNSESEKIIALDIDRYLLNLNESSTEIAFRPDSLRVPKGMMTPQAWEEQSRYNKLRADNELATSVKLRESMLLTIDQTYNDIKAQREVTDFAMRKRLHEMMKTADDLQYQRQKILQEMCKVEKEIQDLEDALLDKSNKMKLAKTRLENRTYRFGVELTRDDAQYGLNQEAIQLRAVLKALQIKINDAKKALNMLLGFLKTLESEIENKNEAKVIEQMALDVRGRVAAQAETPLTKTDRNLALSATVPVPEEES